MTQKTNKNPSIPPLTQQGLGLGRRQVDKNNKNRKLTMVTALDSNIYINTTQYNPLEPLSKAS